MYPNGLTLTAAAALICGSVLLRPEGLGKATADAPMVQAAAPAFLELVSLTAEPLSDRVQVAGIVRNRSAHGFLEPVLVTTWVVGADAGAIASGRATIDPMSLVPHGDAPFLIDLPGPPVAGRYRVSFSSSGRLLAHVDQRTAP